MSHNWLHTPDRKVYNEQMTGYTWQCMLQCAQLASNAWQVWCGKPSVSIQSTKPWLEARKQAGFALVVQKPTCNWQRNCKQ